MRGKITNNGIKKRPYNRKKFTDINEAIEDHLDANPAPVFTPINSTDRFIRCSELIRTYNIESTKLLDDLMERLKEINELK